MTLAAARREGRRGMAMAVLSALLLEVAYLPLPSALLVLGALIPLWMALQRAEDVRRGAALGAGFGVTFWALHLAWVPWVGLRIEAAWPWTAWAGQTALLGLLAAGMGAAFVLLRQRGLGVVPAAVIGWVGIEFIRGHLLGPLSFPWSGLALPLARVPVLAQPAAWGGESLLAAGVVAVNATLAKAVSGGQPQERGARIAPLLAVSLGLALWTAVGWGRRTVLEDRTLPQARAVVVQPGIALADKRSADAPATAWASLRWGLAEAARPVREDGVTLVIFPETHLPFAAAFGGSGEALSPGTPPGGAPGGAGPWPDSLTDEISGWARSHGASVLVGGYRRDLDGTRNALLHLGPAGLEGFYDKVALVPGVERGPGGLVPGTGPGPLRVEGDPGALICIESSWGSLARRQALAGAGWLLNVTNDAWLGEGGMRSPAFDQHPWHLVLRSIETGRGALRVANNGWTGSVDPFGRWVAALPPDRPGVAVVSVSSLPGDPIFVRFGDAVGPLCLALLALGAVFRRAPVAR